MGGNYSVPPLERIEGEGPEWDELRRLNGKARSAQIDALEQGMSPSDSEEYVEAEARFQRMKRRLLREDEQ